MIRLLRDFRFIPIALVATSALFALKLLGLVLDGGYVLGDPDARSADDIDITGSVAGRKDPALPVLPPAPPAPRQSWAQQMFNYPDITGSVAGPNPPEQEPTRASRPSPQDPPGGHAGWTPVPVETDKPVSPAERAILERLQARRGELEARSRELDMRENLIKAAEKRIEARIAELKDLEGRVATAVQQQDDGEAQQFKNVVTMYENMKAKDAAKIFDRLDLRVLVDVATQINPRRMSDILAQMAPEGAERLTVELATRAVNKDKSADLPKIEGRPTAAQ